MSITELAIKRPSLIVVIFSVLAFLGILSYSKLNYELMPKFSIPVVSVTTVYPGASPTEVENSVTKVLEDALSNLENLDEIKSTSMEGVSSVVLMLKPDSDANQAIQDAQRKVNAILSRLPDDVQSPSLGKFSFDEAPIMRLGVTAKMPPSELYSLVKDEVKPLLGRVKGAAQISIVGGEERMIRRRVDPLGSGPVCIRGVPFSGSGAVVPEEVRGLCVQCGGKGKHKQNPATRTDVPPDHRQRQVHFRYGKSG